ncbi:MAG: hypothetical protein L0J63_01245 [Tetragenococcus koreensis]|nr:hypothetical protein [Tetragenococcus koreensis]
MNSETVIVGIITAVLTYLGTRTKGQADIKRQELESETNSEGMYVENMSVILSEYKEQVSGFRDEVRQLRAENASIKQEFNEFRKASNKKVEEYKKYVDLLETENEEFKEENAELRTESEELKEENTELKLEVSYLKGENE